MKNKTWSCKIKKDCYKAYMATYQIGDWIKVGVYLGQESMGSGPLPLLQTDQIVPSILVSSKQKSVHNILLNHKVFENRKTEFMWKLFCFVFI